MKSTASEPGLTNFEVATMMDNQTFEYVKLMLILTESTWKVKISHYSHGNIIIFSLSVSLY